MAFRVDLIARPGGGRSGVGRYAKALAREFELRGLDVQETPTVGALSPALSAFGRRAGLDAQAFFASYPWHVGRRPGAVLHVTAQTFATLLWRQPGGVVTVHDLFPEDQAAGFRSAIVRVFDAAGRLALRRADAIITGSEATANVCRARGLGRVRPVTACSYGVDHAVFRRVESTGAYRRSLGVPEDAAVLLYVGTEAPRKQVHILIHLLAAIRRRGYPNAVLVKVGAPHYVQQRERLRALAASLDVTDGVRWVNGVTEEQLVSLYSLATVYVSASGREGFGLPVLEAMACGAVVAVSDIPPHREIVEDAGALLPLGRCDVWIDRLQDLIGDIERREAISRRAQERASVFTWARTAERTLAVYQRIADA